MSEGGFILTCAGGIVLLVAAVCAVIGVSTYYHGRSECSAFSRQTGYETKFEVLVQPLGVPLTWDCFALQDNGKWIPKSRLRDIE